MSEMGDIKIRVYKGNLTECWSMGEVLEGYVCLGVTVEPGEMSSGYERLPKFETLGNEGPPPVQVIECAKGLTLDHLAKAEGLARFDGEADGSLRWRLTETLKATQAPPSAQLDTFRQDLARVFGLAADAPDEVLLSTAAKVWGGSRKLIDDMSAECCEWRKTANNHQKGTQLLSDKLGDLEHENKRLRAMLGRRLVDDLAPGEAWLCCKCHTTIDGKCTMTTSGPIHPECHTGRVHHFK
jgi:hypothetical protein